MAAAVLHSLRGRTATTPGIITQIWTAAAHWSENPIHSSSSNHLAATFSKVWYTSSASAYEKNLEDQVAVSDGVREPLQPADDKYWEPHPYTGVFGPADAADAQRMPYNNNQLNDTATHQSAGEEKAWFRHTGLEDLEKPSAHH